MWLTGKFSFSVYMFRGGGENPNYRWGIIAKGSLWMVCCHRMFCGILCCLIGEMCEDELLSFKVDLAHA